MSIKPKVLVVEDEPEISAVVTAYLSKEGCETLVIRRGWEVLPAVRQMRFDLILLDVNLPDLDGFTLCKSLRSTVSTPIIMLTARGDELDRIKGLDFGADDYVAKPFSPAELMARIRAVLRRVDGRLPMRHGQDLVFDKQESHVRFRGVRLELTQVEFLVLEALYRGEGRVRTRAQLSEAMGGAERASDRTVDTHIKNIRKKIAAVAPDADLIKSSYGVGYRIDT